MAVPVSEVTPVSSWRVNPSDAEDVGQSFQSTGLKPEDLPSSDSHNTLGQSSSGVSLEEVELRGGVRSEITTFAQFCSEFLEEVQDIRKSVDQVKRQYESLQKRAEIIAPRDVTVAIPPRIATDPQDLQSARKQHRVRRHRASRPTTEPKKTQPHQHDLPSEMAEPVADDSKLQEQKTERLSRVTRKKLRSWPRVAIEKEPSTSVSVSPASPRSPQAPHSEKDSESDVLSVRGLDSPRVTVRLRRDRLIGSSPRRYTASASSGSELSAGKMSMDRAKYRMSMTLTVPPSKREPEDEPLPHLLGRSRNRSSTHGCSSAPVHQFSQKSPNATDESESSAGVAAESSSKEALPETPVDTSEQKFFGDFEPSSNTDEEKPREVPKSRVSFEELHDSLPLPWRSEGSDTGKRRSTPEGASTNCVDISAVTRSASCPSGDAGSSAKRSCSPKSTLASALNLQKKFQRMSSTEKGDCDRPRLSHPETTVFSAEPSSQTHRSSTTRRCSLDDVLPDSTMNAPPSNSESYLSSHSMSLFALQRALAHKHSEALQLFPQECVDARYVGLPCLKVFFRADPHQTWCSSGASFYWLGSVLKFLGVLCYRPPWARSQDNPSAAHLWHMVAFVYMTIWHACIWLSFVVNAWHVLTSSVAAANLESVTDHVWATVRVVLILAAACSHLASFRYFSGGAFADLAQYALRSMFIKSWSESSKRTAIILIAPILVLGGGPAFTDGVASAIRLVVVAWVPLVLQYHSFLTAVDFCSLGLDAFALDLLSTSGLKGIVARFDKLHASMRRSAYHVQAGLTIFVTALFVALFATVYHLIFARRGMARGGAAAVVVLPFSDAGNLVAVASASGLALLGLHLLNQIAMVNAKCRRLPSLIQSLNFGAEIDHDKWCVAEHIASLEAGFFIYNVPVTRWSVLKFGYSALAATSFLLTRLVFAASS